LEKCYRLSGTGDGRQHTTNSCCPCPFRVPIQNGTARRTSGLRRSFPLTPEKTHSLARGFLKKSEWKFFPLCRSEQTKAFCGTTLR
jgi:hypothetical protein